MYLGKDFLLFLLQFVSGLEFVTIFFINLEMFPDIFCVNSTFPFFSFLPFWDSNYTYIKPYHGALLVF